MKIIQKWIFRTPASHMWYHDHTRLSRLSGCFHRPHLSCRYRNFVINIFYAMFFFHLEHYRRLVIKRCDLKMSDITLWNFFNPYGLPDSTLCRIEHPTVFKFLFSSAIITSLRIISYFYSQQILFFF